MKVENIGLSTPDRVKLNVVYAVPDHPKGCVVLVHGFGEHTGRYRRVNDFLVGRGYAVVRYDQRGHGKTPGKRGVVRRYASLIDDLDAVVAFAQKQLPGLPIALYGHSMGGTEVLFRLLFAGPLPEAVSCVVAGSPWLRLATPPPKAVVAMARIVSAILPDFTAKSTLKVEDLTRAEDVREETRKDPDYLLSIGARLFQGMAAAGELLLHEPGPAPRPLLVLMGTDDRVASHEAMAEFVARVGPTCEARVWEGFYHELHNEPEREEVLAAVDDFLARRLAAPADPA